MLAVLYSYGCWHSGAGMATLSDALTQTLLSPVPIAQPAGMGSQQRSIASARTAVGRRQRNEEGKL